jgi:polyisoprenoid-binding protein YceI
MRSTFRLCAAAAIAAFASHCSKEQPSPTRTAPPPSANAPSANAGSTRFDIDATGEATFLIDAPLEKIKGRSGKLRGYLDIDPKNLRAVGGSVEVDLDDLVTTTFDDPTKNKTQTEHAHNWLEIGSDVEAKRREENRWARFTIHAIEPAAANTVAAATERDGERQVSVEARGDLWVHGVTSPKTLHLDVSFVGPAVAPKLVRFRSSRPLSISLREHDVKPRDLAGKFLSGALEKVGQKIDDTVQVSFDGHAAAR